MEMCYDGALVMPKNFAVVNEEEMTYVDGGYYLNADKCNKIAAVACAIGGVTGAAKDVVAVIGMVDPELISKTACIVTYIVCAAISFMAMSVSAYFWYASANGGVTFSWSGIHFGK